MSMAPWVLCVVKISWQRGAQRTALLKFGPYLQGPVTDIRSMDLGIKSFNTWTMLSIEITVHVKHNIHNIFTKMDISLNTYTQCAEPKM